MMYYDFNVGNDTYKLRLNTRNIVALEKQLGCNPLMVFGDGSKIPTVTEMINILYASLLQFNHSISLEDAYTIFDRYLEEHSTTDFIQVILEVYKVSGIIRTDAEAVKN